MSLEIRSDSEQEDDAVLVVPAPLPKPTGEQKFQLSLDSNKTYQRILLAAFAFAFFAGTGFGSLSAYSGWLHAVLWYVTAASLATMCLAPRLAFNSVKGEDDPKLIREKQSATQETLRLLAVIMLACGVLGSVRGGLQGVFACLAACGAAFGFWLTSRNLHSGLGWIAMYIIGIGAFVLLARQAGASNGGVFASGVFGAVMAGTIYRISPKTNGKRNVALAQMRITSVAWLFGNVVGGAPASTYLSVFAVSIVVLAFLQTWSIDRGSFLSVTAILILIHLSAAPTSAANLHAPMLLQLLSAAAEFGLLVAGGYQFFLAAVQRSSRATYRAGPLCIVPRTELARDYPVKISVA